MPVNHPRTWVPVDLTVVEAAVAKLEETNDFGRALDVIAFLPALVGEITELRSRMGEVADLYHDRVKETAEGGITDAEEMFLADISNAIRD
ncbi:hypothetical protein [Agromyces humi]|uniref:hypothetical protein n=1 Tax=Agromyces humi TaxID=1766800 RepID=UPI0013588E6F|nr:hypothetical protein [Agromyces humi]